MQSNMTPTSRSPRTRPRRAAILYIHTYIHRTRLKVLQGGKVVCVADTVASVGMKYILLRL